MKVLYLFNKVLGDNVNLIKEGKEHDSLFFGMFRLSRYGIQADFLEIEKYISKNISKFLRKYIFTMHYAHIPLFPLFFKYDVIITSTAYGSLFLKALFKIKKFKWIVLDFNILGTIKEEKTLKEKIFAWSIRNGVDGIVAISQAEADALKVKFPHIQDKIIFIHEATDTNFFKPDQNTKEKNQIITVGNFGRDFETIIEAVKDLNTELLIVGKFNKEKIGSLPQNVKVTQLNHEDILKAYRESKISIVSVKTNKKYFDSVGTFALIESMSMRKATIVTYTKNMESYIEDNKTGIFVGEGDISDMKEKISKLLENDSSRNDLGNNSRDFAIKNLDSDIFANKLANFIKSVV